MIIKKLFIKTLCYGLECIFFLSVLICNHLKFVCISDRTQWPWLFAHIAEQRISLVLCFVWNLTLDISKQNWWEDLEHYILEKHIKMFSFTEYIEVVFFT